MRESSVEQKLVAGVKDLGGIALKLECPGYTGVPDRLVLLPGGRVRFVELKAPGRRERPRQRVVQSILRGMGFIVYSTVDSPAAVQSVLQEIREDLGDGV